MTEFFSACGYPKSITEEAMRRVKRISRAYALSPAVPAACKRPIVSVLYHPHNLPVCWILRSNWYILENSATVGTTFCDRPLVAFKKDLNLRDILVHSNLHSHVNTTSSTFPCITDRCKACPPPVCQHLHQRSERSNVHQEDLHLSEQQPGVRHHLSVMQNDLCW